MVETMLPVGEVVLRIKRAASCRVGHLCCHHLTEGEMEAQKGQESA